jgi:hypothetical protein
MNIEKLKIMKKIETLLDWYRNANRRDSYRIKQSVLAKILQYFDEFCKK